MSITFTISLIHEPEGESGAEHSSMRMVFSPYLTRQQALLIHDRVVEFTKEQVEAHRGKE
jgi:hypothetical protein